MHERRKYNGLIEGYRFAAQHSPDKSTRVGAVLFGITMQRLAVSCNMWPRGIKDEEKLHDKPIKYATVVHAEQAAILEAARFGWATNTGTLVAGWAACSQCARTIIQAGIGTLVVHSPALRQTPERWRDEMNFGLWLMKEAGVKIEELTEPVGEKMLMDGKWINV